MTVGTTDRAGSPTRMNDQAPQGAMIPAEKAGPPAQYDPFGSRKDIWTNLDMSSEDDRRTFAMAKLLGGEAADGHIGRTLEIAAVVIYPVPITDKETGEVVELPRTVLCLADGTFIGFVSTGVIDSLATLMMLYGRGPWRTPIRADLIQVKLGGSKRLYKLMPTASAAGPKKGGK